ncbi:formyltransferase family protein [Pelagibacteraceae bacterium]|nr:formyltransferase family protein [Pelagibacteraceae bacterium]
MNHNKKIKICLFYKKEKPFSDNVANHLKKISILTKYDTSILKKNSSIFKKRYDIVINYIGGWILPKYFLHKTKFFNINFHPGSLEYPGIGSFNFALYNNEKYFGVTAHHMDTKVDTGKIIKCNYFKIKKNFNVKELSDKTYAELYELFIELYPYFNNLNLKTLPISKQRWKKMPYTRKQLNLLSKLNLKMSKKEFLKRIRCTYFEDKPSPFLIINGERFDYVKKK